MHPNQLWEQRLLSVFKEKTSPMSHWAGRPGLDPRSAEVDGRIRAVFRGFVLGFLCLQMLSRKAWSPLLLSLPCCCSGNGKPSGRLRQDCALCFLPGFVLKLWSICGLPHTQPNTDCHIWSFWESWGTSGHFRIAAAYQFDSSWNRDTFWFYWELSMWWEMQHLRFPEIWPTVTVGLLAVYIPGLILTWNNSVRLAWCSYKYEKLTCCSFGKTWCSLLKNFSLKKKKGWMSVSLPFSPPVAVQVKPDASREQEREAPRLQHVQAQLSCSKQLVSPARLVIYFVLAHCPRVMTNVLQILIYITCA